MVVNHCLLGLPGVPKEELKRVLSHPQVICTQSSALTLTFLLGPHTVFTGRSYMNVRQGNKYPVSENGVFSCLHETVNGDRLIQNVWSNEEQYHDLPWEVHPITYKILILLILLVSLPLLFSFTSITNDFLDKVILNDLESQTLHAGIYWKFVLD